jgi:predicted porin
MPASLTGRRHVRVTRRCQWGGEIMRGFGAAAASAAVVLMSGAGGAYAADLDAITKAPVLKAPAGQPTCTGIADFFTTACQLAWYGVRFYGTVDVGYGYQTHASPFNSLYGPGVDYMLAKSNRGGMGLLSPNGLSQSNIGLQIKEPLGQGWSFVAQLEAGFDPYSLNAGNGPGSQFDMIHVPLALQTSNGDSSRAGQFYNSVGFFGFSNDTYGTLTFFRQNELTLDAISAYDPMGGAYAFSPIGYSGVTSGGGYTEDARETTAIKYRVNIGNYRIGLFGQVGGYDLNNGARGTFQGQVGGDFKVGPGLLSVDAIGGYTKDAVSLSLTGPTDKFGNPTNIYTATETLGASISNNTNVMALAKYTYDKLKLYAGYEWIQFANPSDAVSSFTDVSGDQICANTGAGSCGALASTSINNAPFAKDKILQVVWAGARYSLTDSVDVAAAYYHYDQNNYATGTTLANCSINGDKSSSQCAGTMDAVSFLVDWRFAPKWDTYIGTMFSQQNGGLDNGYLQKNNWATTGGLRFRW